MKKILFILLILFVSTSISNAYEKKNCEGKALINKFFCKKNISIPGGKKDEGKKSFSLKPNLKNFKEAKTLSDLFKKKE